RSLMRKQRKPATRLAANGIAPHGNGRTSPPRRAHGPGSGTSALPLEVARQAQREMDRLRRLPPGTPEAAQVRVYLHWLWSLPWDVTSVEDADLSQVEEVLNREHLGLPKAKERILEYLSVRQLKPDLPGPALCLVGPP